MTGQPLVVLPRLDQLNPRQQMEMDCARCARRLGASGVVWGEVRYLGLMFRLWVCGPRCQLSTSGSRAGWGSG
ncbi:hypothetical protein DF268_45475 [Streptomyces sp. V2]|nr:hypothetical protein DF268_45475 [Streptomyces sp. V2]